MTKIEICMGSSCFHRGNKRNLEVVQKFIQENELDARVVVSGRLCQARCASGPVVKIGGNIHTHVDDDALLGLLEKFFLESAEKLTEDAP